MTTATLSRAPETLTTASAPVVDIRDHAMLVSLTVRTWSATLYDRTTSDEVAERNHAKIDAGRYYKRLLPKKVLAAIRRCESDARNAHYAVTMPWDGHGSRLLPISLYQRYLDRLDPLVEQMVDRRSELANNYHTYIHDSKLRLGELFDPTDYPSVEEVERRIGISYSFDQISDIDCTLNLPAEHIERISRDMQNRYQQRIQETVTDLYDRLAQAVRTCQDRLEPTDEGKPKTFRNSMLGNLQGIVETLPALNLTGDPKLAFMCQRISEAIVGVSPDELRRSNRAFSEGKHRRVKKTVDDLAEQFAGYFGDER